MTTGAFELGRDGPSTVVVGVDGTDTSLRALAYALGLVRRQRSTLVVVFAQRAPAGYAAAAGIQLNVETAEQLRATVEALAAEHGVTASFVSRPGDPVAVLTEVADECRADAVIVGASQGKGHRLFGSIALRAVKTRRWPVTVVP